MAAHRRPSFLKREKERKRVTRAIDKREEKRARKRARDEANAVPEAPVDEALAEERPDDAAPTDEEP